MFQANRWLAGGTAMPKIWRSTSWMSEVTGEVLIVRPTRTNGFYEDLSFLKRSVDLSG